MFGFLLLLNFFLSIIILCLCISILKTFDSLVDLALDNDKSLRHIEKLIRRLK